MSYEDRVLARLVKTRQLVEQLQARVNLGAISRSALEGELEAVKASLTRAMLEPTDDVVAQRVDAATTEPQASRLTLVTTSLPHRRDT